MTYELAKQLKDAGFPQEGSKRYWKHLTDSPEGKIDKWVVAEEGEMPLGSHNFVAISTLSELIEACGDDFRLLRYDAMDAVWTVIGTGNSVKGDTPEEAVARLWLALNEPNE